MIFFEVAVELCIPLLMADIIDIGVAERNMPYILEKGGIMILLAFICMVFGILSGSLEAVSAVGFADETRKALFKKIQSLSFGNIEKFGTASLITRATTDVNNLETAFATTVKLIVKAPMLLIISSIIAVSISPQLSLIFFTALPIVLVIMFAIYNKSTPLFELMLNKYDRMTSSVQQTLVAARTVKSFGHPELEQEKFLTAAEKLKKAQAHAEKLVAFSAPLMQLVMYFFSIAILWFGGEMIIHNTLLPGNLISFFAYLTQILSALLMIAAAMTTIVLSRASIQRIVTVLDETADIQPPKSQGLTEFVDGSIILKNVSFSYGGKSTTLALSDINLEIKSGETIGIIGSTGSSKSTLVQLLPRLYDATYGSIYIGGHNIKDYSLRELRESVALVQQTNLLFSGTVKENVQWGNPDAADQAIVRVCKIVQAHDFIMQLPNGYDTVLNQGGVNLSGGQKQRLCIARALLKKPRILILDDSTSAVNASIDLKIRHAFRENIRDITTITIAQRISSVIDSDRIIVMDSGRINAVGTHEELLKCNSIYRETYLSQQRGEQK